MQFIRRPLAARKLLCLAPIAVPLVLLLLLLLSIANRPFRAAAAARHEPFHAVWPLARTPGGPDAAARAAERAAAPPHDPNDWRACADDACCRRLLSPKGGARHIVANASVSFAVPARTGDYRRELKFRVALHSGADIVSQVIHGNGHWDLAKTRAVLAALQGGGGGLAQVKDATLLDIGANIGWFSVVAATAGFEVVAVEPFAENRAVLQHSLCLAGPAVRERVQLVPHGLHDVDGVTCELWQNPEVNYGDTITICDVAGAGARVAEFRAAGNVRLGEARMRRLDGLIADRTVRFRKNWPVVQKIDVEGFEPFAMGGAREFLASPAAPAVIFSEYSPSMIELGAQAVGESADVAKERPAKYLADMQAAGYTLSESGDQTQEIREVRFDRRRT
jgi:FkbM family methyltransferase